MIEVVTEITSIIFFRRLPSQFVVQMLSLPFELALALRYLRPKRTFVSVITLICIAGVMLGVAVLVIVLSVMTGFDLQFRERLIGTKAHLQIEQRHPMTQWREVMDRLTNVAGVRGVAPYVNTQVLLKAQLPGGETHTFGAVVRGISPALESRINRVTNSVIEGEFRLTPRSILVGYVLADNFHLRPGDKISVYSPRAFERLEASLDRAQKSGQSSLDEVPLAEDYKVRGLFDLGLNDLNVSVAITSLEDAQDLAGYGDSIQGLSMMLVDASPEKTQAAREQIQKVLGADYGVATWMSDNREYLDALGTERSMMFYLLFFIVIVAAFGIMSALITFVVQKTREIGMLKALGAGPLSIASLFLGQSVVVGVLGVASGLAVGLTALRFRNEFLRFMNEKLGFNLFPPSVYLFRELPAKTVASDVIVICVFSLLFCLLAGVLPAIRAALLQPVKALRNE